VSSQRSKKEEFAALIRAARALLGWSQHDLANASMVSRPTIAEIERGVREPQPRTIRDLRDALFKAGVMLEEPFEDVKGYGVYFFPEGFPRRLRDDEEQPDEEEAG
jgi:transcriptional regulator with XRE-family HTH domain